jgi:hypothetical protein
MSNMFNFFLDMENYEDRKVDNYESGKLYIDTCAVSDGAKPFETAVEHPYYKNGKMVIVEAYDTKKEAQEGHSKWVKRMTAKILPEQLVDCQNAGLSVMLSMVDDMIYPRIKTTKKGKTK